MQSSAAVAFRALVMLACVAGIPALAMSGTSWSEILKKFKNLHWPTSASLGGSYTAAPDTTVVQLPSQRDKNAALVAAVEFRNIPMESHDIQQRLQELGATYYLLESWGSEQQLYRFYCKVAMGENADYTHYFEAVRADPLQAMRQVLRQVESWKEGRGQRAEGGMTSS